MKRFASGELGATCEGSSQQSDTYYRHPVRDFAVTDEAFRLRRDGDCGVLTYKGPKLDVTTKTRVEHETRLADGAENLASADEVIQLLGFQTVAIVAKRREIWRLACDGQDVEAALDEVEGAGTFVELELSVEAPDAASGEAPLDAARALLARAIANLGLADAPNERRSYLELVLAAARK